MRHNARVQVTRFIVLATWLAGAPAAAAEPVGGASERVLSNETAAPLTTADRTGFLDVIVGEAFRRAGLSLRLERLPAERALLLADAGAIDGTLFRPEGVEAQYTNLLRVPEAVFALEFAAFGKNTSTSGSLAAMAGRTVGVVRGWKKFERDLEGVADVVTVEGVPQLFGMLDRDRLEIAIFARRAGQAYLATRGITDVRVLEPSLGELDMFIYLHRRHAAEVASIAEALRSLKREGVYQRTLRATFPSGDAGKAR